MFPDLNAMAACLASSIWTHDGSKAASLRGGQDIKICDIGSGKIVTGAKCGPYPVRDAIVSPDNRRLAVEWGGSYVGSDRVEPGLGIYDLGTGRAKKSPASSSPSGDTSSAFRRTAKRSSSAARNS